MMKTRLTIAATLVSSMLMATSASAEVSGNVALTSDYVWRGISQSANDPAIQGGFDYAHESGVYAGIWGSNVDWWEPVDGGADNEEDLEIDYYAGYAGEVGDGIGYDVGVIAYTYPGSVSDVDFNEIYIGASYDMFSAKYSYSNDFGNGGSSAWYLEAGADVELPEGFGLALHVGKSDGSAFNGGTDYVDYSIGVSKEFAGLGFDLTYYDTDKDTASGEDKIGANQNDGTVAFTVSKSF
jgi:uncharacterized protein (TIGR02001 family)